MNVCHKCNIVFGAPELKTVEVKGFIMLVYVCPVCRTPDFEEITHLEMGTSKVERGVPCH